MVLHYAALMAESIDVNLYRLIWITIGVKPAPA
jgi:hypothetical protein